MTCQVTFHLLGLYLHDAQRFTEHLSLFTYGHWQRHVVEHSPFVGVELKLGRLRAYLPEQLRSNVDAGVT